MSTDQTYSDDAIGSDHIAADAQRTHPPLRNPTTTTVVAIIRTVEVTSDARKTISIVSAGTARTAVANQPANATTATLPNQIEIDASPQRTEVPAAANITITAAAASTVEIRRTAPLLAGPRGQA